MDLLVYVPFGLVPSFIWLAYYLGKDKHPEPKRILSEIFILGMLSTFLAFALQVVYLRFAKVPGPIIYAPLYVWGVLALIEEISKFVFVRLRLKAERAFDELPDAMMYMIVSGLGFAAFENILYLTQLPPFTWEATLDLTGKRFIGSTFLHALSSGMFGYFWALSLKHIDSIRSTILVIMGIIAATVLHTGFNYSILIEEPVVTLTILLVAALFVGGAFKKLDREEI